MNNTIKFSVDTQNSGKRLDVFLRENIENYTRSFLKKLIGLLIHHNLSHIEILIFLKQYFNILKLCSSYKS